MHRPVTPSPKPLNWKEKQVYAASIRDVKGRITCVILRRCAGECARRGPRSTYARPARKLWRKVLTGFSRRLVSCALLCVSLPF